MALNNKSNSLEFDAFLSHSSLDKVAVVRIHSRLERYLLPKKIDRRPRKLRIFNYTSDASLNPSLEKALFNRVSEIGHLIIIASRNAVTSKYVEFEIQSYLKIYNTQSKIHVVIVNGVPPDCFPPSLKESFPNPVYADLRIAESNWLIWNLWKKRLFNKRAMPLLASLFEVDLDMLIQRERQRRMRQWATFAGVILVFAGLFAFRYFQTPSHYWIENNVSEDRKVMKAVVMKTADGKEIIRSLSRWSHFTISDIPSRPMGMINEFDLFGRRTGDFRYFHDADGEGEIYRTGDTTLWGFLGKDIKLGKVDTIKSMNLPGLLYAYNKADSCLIREDSFIECNGLTIGEINIKNFEADASRIAEKIGYKNSHVLPRPVFFYNRSRLLSFSYLYNSNSYKDTNAKNGTLTRISYDNGKSWKDGTIIPERSTWEIEAVSDAGPDWKTIYVAFQGVRENPDPNAIFHSEDDGLSWKPVNLPKEAQNHENWLLEDIATASSDKNFIAVLLSDSKSGKLKNMIFISKNKGESWHLLDAGMALSESTSLCSITADGSVLAVSGGRLYLWRQLTVFERLRLIVNPVR
jgi:hypothetical protein